MERTKLRLMLDYPFFGSLALTMTLKENEHVSTIMTDGKTIQYNKDFVRTLTRDQKLFVYLHEICHVILGHTLRRGSRDPKIWNIAGDYAVNILLKDSTHLSMPNCALFDRQYENWSTERIYESLSDDYHDVANDPDQPEDPENQEDDGSDHNADQPSDQDGNLPDDTDVAERRNRFREMVEASESFGTVSDSPAEDGVTEGDIRSAAALVERIVTSTGGDPGDRIRELVGTFTDTKISWRDLLSSFIYESCADQYDWMRPNRRYSGNGGVILPSMTSNDSITIAVAIDTSGSINDNLLSAFINELRVLLHSINYKEVTIMGCSSVLQEPRIFQKGEDIDFVPIGGGSTSFAPVFEYVANMENMPACLIYFTDIFSNDFGQAPGCPVLWIGKYTEPWMKAHQDRIPFGTIVNMDMAA